MGADAANSYPDPPQAPTAVAGRSVEHAGFPDQDDHMKPQTGFTLLETLVTVALAAILLTVALPAYNSAMAAAHAGSAQAALAATVLDSVRHAGLGGVEVVACPSAAGTGCDDSWDWSRGWIVFADTDGNRRRDLYERLVKREPALADRVRLRSTTGRRRLVFQPSGGNAGSNVTFTLCDTRGASRASSFVISNGGRLRTAPAAPSAAADCMASL
jgi:type IV fimbrial biogenesis protein FimT